MRDTLLSFLPANIRTFTGVASQGCKLGHSDYSSGSIHYDLDTS